MEAKVTSVCEACSASFQLHACDARRGRGRFCSQTCSRKPRTTLAERFWAKVDKNGPVPAHMPHLGPCWVWTASVTKATGYGQMSIGGTVKNAHRIAWEMANGATDLCVLHRCDNRRCVRPDHLFPGTHADNTADMIAKSRNRAAPVSGEAHPMAKITDAGVREIVRDFRAGAASAKDLAASHGLTASYVRMLSRGESRRGALAS